MEEGRRGPGRPRKPGSNEALLTVARELVATRGVAGWTMDELAGAAAVSKPTIYLRWPSKDALVLDLVRRELPAGAAAGITPTGDARADLEALVLYGLGVPRTGPPDWLARPDLMPFLARARLALDASARRLMEDVLRAGIATGQVAPGVDTGLLVDVVAGYVSWVATGPRPPGQAHEPAELARRLVTFLWPAVAAGGRPG